MRTLLVGAVCCFMCLCLTDSPWCQSIQVEQERLQRQVDDLRRDVEELKSVVSALRQNIMRKGTNSDPIRAAKSPDPESPKKPPQSPIDEAQVKRQVCGAVGHFFQEIDQALKMSDGDAAENFMRSAVASLNKELEPYRTYPRVRHILSLAEGLAWDTYTAVESRYATVGNSDFIEAIGEYRRKYREHCSSQDG